MSLTNAAETDLLELIFNATTWLTIAEDKVTGPATDLYLSLHESLPDETGNQSTGETAYTNYARVSVARATGSGGWTVAGDTASNVSDTAFDTCGATGATITHVGIGTDASGAGNLICYGTLTTPLVVSNGIAPTFLAGELDITAA